MRRAFSVCLLLLAACFATRAQNWPQFRGPRASGVAEGAKTPLKWDGVKGEGVLWKTAIPGLSHASPVVWGERVFVITAVSAEDSPTFVAKDRGIGLARDDVKHTWKIYALDRRSGKIL